MAGKDKKRGFPRSILGNIIEAGGEYTGDRLGKLVMENMIQVFPFLESLAAGLGKTGKELLSLIPYIFTIPVKSELSQDTWQGFLRGLVDVVKNRDAIPDDPGAQKGWFVTHLKPLFDKVHAEGKLDGEKQAAAQNRSFADAFEGMDPLKRKVLREALDRTDGLWDAVDWLSVDANLTSKELDGIAAMSDPAMRLINRLLASSKPPKPQSTMDKMRHRAEQFLAGTADKYLDPKGEGLEKFAKEQETHAKSLETGNVEIAKIFGI